MEFTLAFDLKQKSENVPAEWQDVKDKKIGAITMEIKGERERKSMNGF